MAEVRRGSRRLLVVRHAKAGYPDGVADVDLLTLEVPGDGRPDTLRTVLDRIAVAGLQVEDVSVHTPDLDDVFLALTGRPTRSSDDQEVAA